VIKPYLALEVFSFPNRFLFTYFLKLIPTKAELVIMGLIADTKRALKESPREIFNLNLLLYTWIFSFPGVSKGFDEG
jgi:hypothetical protein